MNLFKELNQLSVNKTSFSIPNSNIINIVECSNITFHSLMTMHIMRQEKLLSEDVRKYALSTLSENSDTNLYEFLHIMHTEILREHQLNEKSNYTINEFDSQIRLTQEFLSALSSTKYDVVLQNFRLLQLENCYKVLESSQKKLRRNIRNWHNESADGRYQICVNLWENISSKNGLIDLSHFLAKYIKEQKWPAPGSGINLPKNASDQLKLINRLPEVLESASSGSTSSGSIATVASPQGKLQKRPSLFGYVLPEDEDDEEQEKK